MCLSGLKCWAFIPYLQMHAAHDGHDLSPSCCLRPTGPEGGPAAGSRVAMDCPIAEEWIFLEAGMGGPSLGLPSQGLVIVKGKKARISLWRNTFGKLIMGLAVPCSKIIFTSTPPCTWKHPLVNLLTLSPLALDLDSTSLLNPSDSPLQCGLLQNCSQSPHPNRR